MIREEDVSLIPKGVTLVDQDGKVLEEQDLRKRLVELRVMVEDSPELKNVRRDDPYLLRFLHADKFKVDEAFERLRTNFRLVLDYPEWFKVPTPRQREDLIDMNMRFFLPGRDRDGRAIYICKIANVDPSVVDVRELVNVDDMWFELEFDDRMTQCKGICILLDVSGYSWKVMKWLTPKTMRFGSRKTDCLPVADMIVHVVNTNFLIEASVRLVWPFLSQKLKDSVKFHFNDYDSLHRHIAPEVLPPEYGGSCPLDYKQIKRRIMSGDAEIAEKVKYYDFIVSGK